MPKFFHAAFQQHFFSSQKGTRRKTKPKQKILLPLYNYVTVLRLGSDFQSTSLRRPPPSHGSVWPEQWEAPRKKSRWISLQTPVKGNRYARDSWIKRPGKKNNPWDTTYIAPSSSYPAIATSWQHPSQKWRCWDKKPTPPVKSSLILDRCFDSVMSFNIHMSQLCYFKLSMVKLSLPLWC